MTVFADTGALVGIAGLLVAVQLLVPPSVRAQLAFDHQQFTLWTLWTSAAVHGSPHHLTGNVVGHLAAAGVAYVLCRAIDARGWFWWTTVAFLTVLPVLVNLTSYGLLGWVAPGAEPVERGFSGVVAGYVGLIFVAFVAWVTRRSGRGMAQTVGQVVVLVLLWELSLIYHGALDPLVTGPVALGLGLSGALFGRVVAWPGAWERRTGWWSDVRIGVGIVAALVAFVVALFPAEPANGGTVTNVLGHASGVVWGALLSAALLILPAIST